MKSMAESTLHGWDACHTYNVRHLLYVRHSLRGPREDTAQVHIHLCLRLSCSLLFFVCLCTFFLQCLISFGWPASDPALWYLCVSWWRWQYCPVYVYALLFFISYIFFSSTFWTCGQWQAHRSHESSLPSVFDSSLFSEGNKKCSCDLFTSHCSVARRGFGK